MVAITCFSVAQLFTTSMATPFGGAARPLSLEKPRSVLTLVLLRLHLRHSFEVHKMNNQINLVGHVGQNPHSVSFSDTGNKVVKFSIAVKMYSSNSDEPKTLWFDVDAWNGLGDRVLDLVTKGRELVLSGRLDISTYTKEINGEKVQFTKPVVKLSSFHLCGPRPIASEDSKDESPVKTNPKKKKLALAKS